MAVLVLVLYYSSELTEYNNEESQ